MEALREMVAPEADVIRDGKMSTIPAVDLVPGDVIYLEAGDKVPADGRIFEETSLEVIESSLTGESLPVEKEHRAIARRMELWQIERTWSSWALLSPTAIAEPWSPPQVATRSWAESQA